MSVTTSAQPGTDGSQAASAAPPAFAPFRSRIFLAMWIASLLSNFGTLIQGVGAAWLMTSLAPSADMVALVQVSTVLPIMLQKELRHSLLLQSRAGQAELRFEVELPQESGAAPVGESEHQS